MVSFSRAFFRVSAVVSATLTDPTSAQLEIIKHCNGSISSKYEPVESLTTVETDVEQSVPPPVCVPKVKLHRFQEFRPCKKLVSKAKKLKSKVKLKLHAFSDKVSSKIGRGTLVSTNFSFHGVSHEMQPLTHHTIPECTPQGDETLFKEFAYDQRSIGKFVSVESSSLDFPNENMNSTQAFDIAAAGGELLGVSCTQGQFSPFYFLNLMYLFDTLQSASFQSRGTTGVGFLARFANLTGYPCLLTDIPLYISRNCFSPLETRSILTKIASSVLDCEAIYQSTSLNNDTLSETSVHCTNLALPVDDVPAFEIFSKVNVVRSSDNAQPVMALENGSELLNVAEHTDDLFVEEPCPWFFPESRLPAEEIDEDVDEGVLIKEINLVLQDFPRFDTLQDLRSQYHVSAAANLTTEEPKPKVKFLDTVNVETSDRQVAEPISTSYVKGCLKKSKKWPSPSEPMNELRINGPWIKQMVQTYLEATFTEQFDRVGYIRQGDKMLVASKLTSDKLNAAVIEVKAHGLHDYAERCLATSHRLSEVFAACLHLANHFLVIQDDRKRFESRLDGESASKDRLYFLKLRRKFVSAKADVSQLVKDQSTALDAYNLVALPLVDSIYNIQNIATRFTCDMWRPFNRSGCTILGISVEGFFNKAHGNFHREYLTDAKQATDNVLKEIQDAVKILDEVLKSLSGLQKVTLRSTESIPRFFI